MARKLTKWLDGSPKYPGVYQRFFRFCDLKRNVYSYWNGSFWGQSGATVYEAFVRKFQSSHAQDELWRGLKKKAR